LAAMRKLSALSLLLVLAPAPVLFAQTPQPFNSFTQTNLVANSSAYNPQIVNPNLLDAWGIALRPPGAGGHIWVNGAESGFDSSTLDGGQQRGDSFEYIGDVGGVPLHQDGLTSVKVDPPGFTDHGYAFVTGLVYNAAKDLTNQPVEFPVPDYNSTNPGQVIEPGDSTQPGQPAQNDSTSPPTPIANTTGSSAFAFVTEDGCINCWRSNTEISMLDAPIVVDYSKTSAYFPYEHNSVFSGSAITVNAYNSQAYISAGGNHLFAADFDNNVIEVFNNQWQDVTASYPFQTPATVGSFHVFNVQDLGGHLYATYAMFDAAGDEGMEETDGAGYGHVVEYNEDGTLVKDFNDQGMLNAPWGVAIAPATFGKFGGDLLVSNFGDGSIAVFDPNTGNFIDQLRDGSGNPIDIDGIWGMVFGNGVSLGDASTLYFTAGPNSEYDGLFGKLTYNSPPMDTPAMPTLALVILGVVLFTAGTFFTRGRRILLG
jgi:uncharacterized protein (TIGR03118 family)